MIMQHLAHLELCRVQGKGKLVPEAVRGRAVVAGFLQAVYNDYTSMSRFEEMSFDRSHSNDSSNKPLEKHYRVQVTGSGTHSSGLMET